jgi:hypothetical protein
MPKAYVFSEEDSATLAEMVRQFRSGLTWPARRHTPQEPDHTVAPDHYLAKTPAGGLAAGASDFCEVWLPQQTGGDETQLSLVDGQFSVLAYNPTGTAIAGNTLMLLHFDRAGRWIPTQILSSGGVTGTGIDDYLAVWNGTTALDTGTATDNGTTFSLQKDLSLYSYGTVTMKSANITNATNASPIVITSNGHGLTDQECVRVEGVGGNTNANGNWRATVIDANTFSLNTSTGNAGYTSGGKWFEGTLILPDTTFVKVSNAYQIYEVIDSGSTWNGSAWTLTNGRFCLVYIATVIATGTAYPYLGLPVTFSQGYATIWKPGDAAAPFWQPLHSIGNVNVSNSVLKSAAIPPGGYFFLDSDGTTPWLATVFRSDLDTIGVNNEYSGATTSSLVTVFDQAGAFHVMPISGYDQVGNVFGGGAIFGGFSMKATVHDIKYQITTIDMHGTSTSSAVTTLTSGSKMWFPFHSVGGTVTAGTPPFSEVKLQVEDAVGGTHGNYDVFLTMIG